MVSFYRHLKMGVWSAWHAIVKLASIKQWGKDGERNLCVLTGTQETQPAFMGQDHNCKPPRAWNPALPRFCLQVIHNHLIIKFSSAFTIIYPPFLSFFTSFFFNFWCLLPPPSQRHPAAIAGLPQQSASVVRLPPAVGDDVQEAIQTPEAHHDVPQHAADDGHQDVPVLTLQVVHVKPG